MLDPDLGDDDLGGALADPGDGVQPVTGRGERGDHLVDAAVQGGDGAFQMLQVVKGQPDQQRMVLAEAARQRLAQLGSFLRSLPLASSARTWGAPPATKASSIADPRRPGRQATESSA